MTKIISISTADLLTGHGHLLPRLSRQYAEQGGLRLHALPGNTGHPNLSCVERSVNIDFNLVGLRCHTRTLRYSQSDYQHEGSYFGSRSQTFCVATVPEPASWGMLLAGVGLGNWAARRRRRR